MNLKRIYNYLTETDLKNNLDEKTSLLWESLANYYYYMSTLNNIDNEENIKEIQELAESYKINIPNQKHKEHYNFLNSLPKNINLETLKLKLNYGKDNNSNS